MKHIEIDEELYQYLVANTEHIGESASSILRRLLNLEAVAVKQTKNITVSQIESTSVNKKPEVASMSVDKPVCSSEVFNYINKEELATQRGAIGRFLLILAALYRVHAEQFSVVTEIRGRDRLYFARSEQALIESGSSTKPRQIPDSDYWVMTNSNTTRKKMMLTEVAKSLGYQSSDIEKIRDLL